MCVRCTPRKEPDRFRLQAWARRTTGWWTQPVSEYSSEADARIVIDGLLRRAGWDPTDKSQVRTEVSIQDVAGMVAEPIAGYADLTAGAVKGGDGGVSGRIDYLLLDQRGRALAIVEAKRASMEPYVARHQALPYAQRTGAPFVFLSNGEVIYFWDYTRDDARLVDSFFSQRDLERLVEMRATRKPLATVLIPEYYVRQGETRRVRGYQRTAMQKLDAGLELGKRRFLIELPTGTGKTDVICLYLKRLLDAGIAERVLFLVDREALALQALEAMQQILPHHGSYWLKSGMAAQQKQVTVCLLQTMIGRYQEFTSAHFDVVIADESHRSIYGDWRPALTHFDAIHIGLTATPAAYVDRNTFRFYQCRDGEPDFAFTIQDAIAGGYLVPYRFASGITVLLAEGAEVDDETYDPEEFERVWTNEATNRLMMEEFDRLAHESYVELAPGQKVAPGKAIVFAISKRHAARLTACLNGLHPEQMGRYAELVSSDVPDAAEVIRRFKREDYPQVVVSVGMLETGFDCREVLHLVMCRRVRSPILYQQMRGRGMRTADHIGKQKFVIYDFFGNHEYFNDSDTDVFAGLGAGAKAAAQPRLPKPPGRLIELGLDDEWLQAVAYVEVGPGGERVDKREYVNAWENGIRTSVEEDPLLQKLRRDEFLTESEQEQLVRRLNSPEMYFNEDNLRRAYRRPDRSLVDFIRLALGTLRIKPREEEVRENFNAWLAARAFTLEQARYLTLLKNRGLVRGRLTVDDLFEPPLSMEVAHVQGVKLFGEEGLVEVIQDLNESVLQKSATEGT